MNGDGLADLIVGAPGDDPNGADSGASFVIFGKTATAAVELSDIAAGIGGFVINGISAADEAGRAVGAAGDVNGDGLDDLIVGAWQDDPNGQNSGASFVVFGGDFTGAATQIGTIGADTLIGSAARDVLIGGTGDDKLEGAGGADVLRGGEGDDVLGIGDLAFARLDGGNGSDTLRLDGAGLALDLTAIPDTAITGIERIDLAGGGNTVTLDKVEVLWLSETSNIVRVLGNGGAGDAVTLRGINWADAGQVTDTEGTFDVFTDGLAMVEIQQGLGLTGGPVAPVELSDIEIDDDPRGFVINGVSQSDLSGHSVSGAGDVNGDGLEDVIVGAWGDDNNACNAGSSFIVFGKTDGLSVELSDVEAGGGGFAIDGVSAGDYAGYFVSEAGDVNGDGLADVIVGAWRDDPNAIDAGASFVVFGKTNGTVVDLSNVEAGSGGFAINGISADDRSGRSVSGAGDVNGDGLDDLIVGDTGHGYGGGAFVVFGKTDTATVLLTDLDPGSGGFVIRGAGLTPDLAGFSVSAAGDVNGDGFDDLIVGAPGDDPNGYSSGASFVVFGGDFTGAATEIGTTGGDSITGTPGGDVIFAGTGNDTVDGAGGADRLSGGQGADVFIFGDVAGTVTVIDFEGGAGQGDQLNVSAFGFANFAALQATASAAGPGGHDTLILLDADDSILLKDFKLADLAADDVIL